MATKHTGSSGADQFTIGSISDALKSSSDKTNTDQSENLCGLFSSTSKFRIVEGVTTNVANVAANKRKRNLVSGEAITDEAGPSCDDDESGQPSAKKQIIKRKGKPVKDPERDARTVFVGNVPVDTTRKDLKKLFKAHGTIESVRLRSAPVETPKVPKRVAVIKKQFHSERHTINAYIVFEKKESADDALQSNGTLVGDCHIRVDTLSKDNKKSSKNTVFVGNLPFGVEEEAVRSHFTNCGEIESVRLIRDKQSNIGKGFGYVCFKDPASVTLALRMTQSELLGRCVRIFRCKDTDVQKKKATIKFKGEFAATSRRKPSKKFTNKNNALQRIDKQKAKNSKQMRKNTTNSNKKGKKNKANKQSKK